MNELDISHVFTEAELACLILDMFSPSDNWQDKHISNICNILKYGDKLACCSEEFLDEYFSEEGATSWCKQWIKNMAGHLANKGFVAFGKVLDSTEEHARTMITNLQNAQKNKSLSEEYINERFAKFDEYRTTAKDNEKCPVKAAVPYEKQMARFGGLINVCETIVSMADTHDEDSFTSDNIWDNLANQTNTVAKAVQPKPGINFKSFKWEPPFVKSFEFKTSEWNSHEKLEDLKKVIFQLKEKAFKDLIEAAKHLQTLCKDMQSEVQHTHLESGEEMARNYARTYLISKL